MMNYGVVLVTTNSVEQAEAIAQTLVAEKLVACVNILPVTSIYAWQGEICRDAEWQLIMKTNLDKFTELEARIKSLHSYEIPEIIALPIIQGATNYLNWLGEQVQ
jgi:periplasmic divalent cation tolerance protein